jgi:hypothetical protein
VASAAGQIARSSAWWLSVDGANERDATVCAVR